MVDYFQVIVRKDLKYVEEPLELQDEAKEVKVLEKTYEDHGQRLILTIQSVSDWSEYGRVDQEEELFQFLEIQPNQDREDT